MKVKGQNKWLGNLPAHTPPDGMWERIEIRMDEDLLNERFQARLAALPEHEPPFVIWTRIEQTLTHRRFVRLGIIASGIAATLLLAFMLNGLFLPGPLQPGRLLTNRSEHRPMEMNRSTSKQNGIIDNQENLKLNTGIIRPEGNSTQSDGERQKNSPQREIPVAGTGLASREKSTALQVGNLPLDILFPADHSSLKEGIGSIQTLIMKPAALDIAKQYALPNRGTLMDTHMQSSKNDTLSAWLLARNTKDDFPPPPSPSSASKPGVVSLGFNYLPEPSMRSDNRSTAFQTFALMAQYQLPSVDVRTSLGISYQASPVEYRADYVSVNSASAVIDKGSLDISGKERSSFLYYTLGAGKRIYTNKRVSTTFRVGAGFSLLLNNQHHISGPVYDALKSQSNTYFTNTESNIPDINQTHFDLVTGFDFSYRLHKRWSLSFEPTLKYYFKPVYNGNNSRSFSTGLRTGVLFKL
jgi:hypothetical protein